MVSHKFVGTNFYGKSIFQRFNGKILLVGLLICNKGMNKWVSSFIGNIISCVKILKIWKNSESLVNSNYSTVILNLICLVYFEIHEICMSLRASLYSSSFVFSFFWPSFCPLSFPSFFSFFELSFLAVSVITYLKGTTLCIIC